MEEFSRPIIEEGPSAANPAVFPNTVYNAAGGQVAMQDSARSASPRRSPPGHAAGASALTYAYDLAASGQPGRRGAVRSRRTRSPTPCSTATATSACSGRARKRQHGRASRSPRALSASLLERASHAAARGARIYGEVARLRRSPRDARGRRALEPRGRGHRAGDAARARAWPAWSRATSSPSGPAACGLPAADEAERRRSSASSAPRPTVRCAEARRSASRWASAGR